MVVQSMQNPTISNHGSIALVVSFITSDPPIRCLLEHSRPCHLQSADHIKLYHQSGSFSISYIHTSAFFVWGMLGQTSWTRHLEINASCGSAARLPSFQLGDARHFPDDFPTWGNRGWNSTELLKISWCVAPNKHKRLWIKLRNTDIHSILFSLPTKTGDGKKRLNQRKPIL